MSVEQIAANFRATSKNRLDTLKASLITADPVPTYSYLDLRDGLGR
jgi:hypothetical protein